MSLLMDALKKAEQAKRGDAEAEPSIADTASELRLEALEPPRPAGGLALEPTFSVDNAETAAPGKLPELSAHLADLDQQFLAARDDLGVGNKRTAAGGEVKNNTAPARDGGTPAASAGKAARGAEARANPPAQRLALQDDAGARAAAGNAFSAKAGKPPKKLFAIAVGSTTVLALAGIGGYFWWQLQPKSGVTAVRLPATVPAAPPTPIASPAVPAVAPSSPPVTTAPVAALPPASPAASATPATAGAPAASAPASKSDRGAASPAPSFSASAKEPSVVAKPPRTATETGVSPAPAAESAGPVVVSRSPQRINPGLTKGYEAFQRGELARAKQEYDRVLKADPLNTDALHGMAALALRDGRADLAEAFYQRLLIADPQDAIAAAHLINLRGKANPAAAEARLKSLSASHPESAPPLFALGNLLAAQERWPEAQQAYFKAYTAEPGNPDILFNLAISLEHLRQTKLALQYYNLAADAAKKQPATFDTTQLEARIKLLQP